MKTVFVIYPKIDGALGAPIFACKSYTQDGALEIFKKAKDIKEGEFSAVPASRGKVKLLLNAYREKYKFWETVATYLCEEGIQ